MEVSDIIKKIKEKKELKNLDDKLILEKIKNYFCRYPKLEKQVLISNKKSDIFKKIVKNLRNELNRIYGCFNLNNNFNLESNSSTKERINIYPILYKDIFRITGKPQIIVDLSCGLNPLSYKYIKFKCKYVVSELNKTDCVKLENYFKENYINGVVLQIDLTKENKIPSGDVCFLFKVLDSIENKGHKLAERLINNIRSRYIVV